MKRGKVPMRMCIGCKQMKPKKELLRVVIPKEGDMAADPTGKQNGRGAYICPDKQCLQMAQKSRSVRLSPQVFAQLSEEIEKRATTQ